MTLSFLRGFGVMFYHSNRTMTLRMHAFSLFTDYSCEMPQQDDPKDSSAFNFEATDYRIYPAHKFQGKCILLDLLGWEAQPWYRLSWLPLLTLLSQCPMCYKDVKFNNLYDTLSNYPKSDNFSVPCQSQKYKQELKRCFLKTSISIYVSFKNMVFDLLWVVRWAEFFIWIAQHYTHHLTKSFFC